MGKRNNLQHAVFLDDIEQTQKILKSWDKFELARWIVLANNASKSIELLLNDLERMYDQILPFTNEFEEMLSTLFIDDDEEDLGSSHDEPCFVYYILNHDKDKVKIGVSSNPISRAKSLQTACGEELEILLTIQFKTREEAFDAERFLHMRFSSRRCKVSTITKSNEWFHADIVPILKEGYFSSTQIKKEMNEHDKRLREAMDKIHFDFMKEA